MPPSDEHKALALPRQDLLAFDLLLKDKHRFVCRCNRVQSLEPRACDKDNTTGRAGVLTRAHTSV